MYTTSELAPVRPCPSMNRRCNARARTQRVKAHVSRFLDDKSNSKTRAAEGAKWLRGWGDRCAGIRFCF